MAEVSNASIFLTLNSGETRFEVYSEVLTRGRASITLAV
jgi:hypothetical protein